MHSSGSANGALRRPTVGIIVVGDEILKGQTRDSNSHFMCRLLHQRGVAVRKVTVVSDRVEDIAGEVRDFSRAYDYVFTTGGIGITHDDRTFEALAAAFDEPLEMSAELESFVRRLLAARGKKCPDLDEAVGKFCRVPASTDLLGLQPLGHPTAADEKADFPSFKVHNVVAFPGVPAFCEQSFRRVQESLFPSLRPFFIRCLHLRKSEIHLHGELNRVVKKHPAALVGSYPVLSNSYFKTKLTVESEQEGDGQAAYNDLAEAFKEFIVDYDEEPWQDADAKLARFAATQSAEFQSVLRASLDTIDAILGEYSLDQISLSFNGGKDCTLLLHLLRCRVNRKYGEEMWLNGFHILAEEEFPQLIEFVSDVSRKYRLRMIQFHGHMRGGLTQLKTQQPSVIAVLMGSRSTDPSSRYMSSTCQWTDADWPKFYRVCPLLDWRYSDVWRTIRQLSIPYCSLYDQGYTSLGDSTKTLPNPALLVQKPPPSTEKEGAEETLPKRTKYRPAYELTEEHLERCSRHDQSPTSGPTIA